MFDTPQSSFIPEDRKYLDRDAKVCLVLKSINPPKEVNLKTLKLEECDPVNFDLFDNSTPIQPPLLQAKNLSREFGGLRALAMVSFNMMPGEIVGVIGPNGAGKTTLFALLSGFLIPSYGEIKFMETPITVMRQSSESPTPNMARFP